ncbi:MAG: RsmE family RNA methyltransferase [Planctomycetota bacterium]|nr:RsmE family RNA methyltransferase [Planctomycetota bacterium]
MRTLLAPAPLRPGVVELASDEAHHGRTVLRLAVGDAVRLVDGAGNCGEARVNLIERHRLLCQLDAVSQPAGPALERLTIVTAAPKGNRFEDMVRGLCELGVGAIQVLRTSRSVRDPKLDRARRVAVEAIKQCGRARLPQVGPVVDFTTLAKPPGKLILLDRDGGKACPGLPEETSIVIGPEGGFSTEERDRLLELGAQTVRLASPILRIETAALAAAAVWANVWEQHEQ